MFYLFSFISLIDFQLSLVCQHFLTNSHLNAGDGAVKLFCLLLLILTNWSLVIHSKVQVHLHTSKSVHVIPKAHLVETCIGY